MLISVHIPKCAGTSFHHHLQSSYGEHLWLNYGTAFNREQALRRPPPAHARCIHGHFLADTFDDLFPERTLITWLRHPVQRVVSNYYHFLRSPDQRDACCRAIYERGLNLRDFAELEWMQNSATRYLANKRLDDFALVGIAERFGESLRLGSELFGWDRPMAEPRVNTNPERSADSYPLAPNDFAHLLELNAQDLRWYEAATARLDRALADRERRAA